MNCIKFTLILAAVALLFSCADVVEAKKRRKSSNDNKSRTKTKTKWSTSTELQGAGDGKGGPGLTPLVASEEHGYYVKRTYMPVNASSDAAATATPSGTSTTAPARQSPPFLAIPIAWFPSSTQQQQSSQQQQQQLSQQASAFALNSELQALSAGFLCDDDCLEPYTPICGRTALEVAVFYNKCKLNVAKCRTHGLWQDYAYEECRAAYPKEVSYAEQKFRASPFFREAEQPIAPEVEKEAIVNIALEALSEIDQKIAEAEAEAVASEQQMVQDNNSNNNNNNNDNNKQENAQAPQPLVKVAALPPTQENETDKLLLL